MQHLISNRSAGTIITPQGERVSELDAFRKPDSYARRFAQEKLARLPELSDLYQAAAYAEQEVGRLVLVMGKDGFGIGGTAYVFLQYLYIGTVELGFTTEGQAFRFVVSDIQPRLVTVYGDNLTHICDHISLRKLQWIRQADRDFTAPVSGGEPVITRIAIRDWRPEDSQPGDVAPIAS